MLWNQFHWVKIGKVVRTPWLRGSSGESALFQLLVASAFHMVIGLGCRIDMNCSVAKVKRWGCTTEGRDEHVIAGCLNMQRTWGSRGESKHRRSSHLHVSAAHGYQIHSILAAYVGIVAASCHSKEPLPLWRRSEIKLSVCLRAIDVHIAKQFQENLHPSRGRELYYLCSEIFGRV